MGKYVTIQNILDEGISTQDYPEQVINTAIDAWEAQVEQTTGQTFTKQTNQTFYVDGYGTNTLVLPARPLAIQVYPSGGNQPIDDTNLRVDPNAWMVTWLRGGKFEKGVGIHIVKGDFGWETPPVPLVRAIVRLVVRTLGTLDIVAGDSLDVPGGVESERMDKRTVRYITDFSNPDIFAYPDPVAWAVVTQHRRPPMVQSV